MKHLKMLLSAGLLAATCGVAAPAMALPAVQLTETINGAQLDVDVSVVDLGGQIVAAYDLDLNYNSGALSFFDVFFDINLGDPLSIQAEDGTLAGLVDLAEVSLLSDAELGLMQNGISVHLAKITFDITDPNAVHGLDLGWGPGNDVKGYNNTVIIPNAVPEPSTVALMVLGLAGLAAARFRKKA